MKKKVLLSLMMFLQYMMLLVWFVPMLPYVQAMPGGSKWTVWCGFIMGFGTFASPLFGMFADRFLCSMQNRGNYPQRNLGGNDIIPLMII